MDQASAQLAELPVNEVLARLAAPGPGPGGGSAAALACAMAAGLIEMTAGLDDSPSAHARLARAEALRQRALELAEREVRSYAPVLQALAMDADDPQREMRIAAARAQAATAPLAIAGLGAQLAGLAAESAAAGTSDAVVGEAVVAAELADGACRAAAHIVRINLQDSPGDPRRTEVTGLVSAAADALEMAFTRASELAATARS